MTSQTTAVNRARFEQGDRPQGSDYADLIDSFVALVDTTAQSMAADLIVPNLIAGTVSAQAINASALALVRLTAQSVNASGAGFIRLDVNVASANSLVGNVCTFASISATNQFQISTFATVDSAGTVDCARVNMQNVAATALTSAQVSACGLSGAIAHLWLVKIEINGSVLAVPCLRSGAHWFS